MTLCATNQMLFYLRQTRRLDPLIVMHNAIKRVPIFNFTDLINDLRTFSHPKHPNPEIINTHLLVHADEHVCMSQQILTINRIIDGLMNVCV